DKPFVAAPHIVLPLGRNWGLDIHAKDDRPSSTTIENGPSCLTQAVSLCSTRTFQAFEFRLTPALANGVGLPADIRITNLDVLYVPNDGHSSKLCLLAC